jgi:hypothetical protein
MSTDSCRVTKHRRKLHTFGSLEDGTLGLSNSAEPVSEKIQIPFVTLQNPVPPACTTKCNHTQSTFFPHSVFMFCTDIRTNSSYFSPLYNINWLVFYNRGGVFTARYVLDLLSTILFNFCEITGPYYGSDV